MVWVVWQSDKVTQWHSDSVTPVYTVMCEMVTGGGQSHCHQVRGSSASSATAILVLNQLLWLLLSFLHTWQISHTHPPCNAGITWHQSVSQSVSQFYQSYFPASQSIKESSRKINVRNNILAQILMKLSCHSLVLSLCLGHLSYFFLPLFLHQLHHLHSFLLAGDSPKNTNVEASTNIMTEKILGIFPISVTHLDRN